MSEPDDYEVHVGDALEELAKLPDGCVQTCVTSPPYWGLRDYGVDGQLGLEPTPNAYVERLVAVFGEVRRVLRDDGTLWLNIGDSYVSNPASGPRDHGFKRRDGVSDESATPPQAPNAVGGRKAGLKPKDLVGIPWRVAFALQQDGWWLRSDIIWHKPNPMPESVTDRPTGAHEHIFLLAKSKRYYYDHEAIKEDTDPDEPGKRNKRDVWPVTTKPYPDAHFAVYPPDLIVPCIKAGSAEGDLVLDPFCGAGTTGVVCTKLGRRFLGIELNDEYAKMARDRINGVPLSLFRNAAS